MILTHPGKYASAAYVSALTRGEKNLTKLESDLKYFNDVLKSDSQDAVKLRTFLTNPTVTAEARSKTISDLLASQKGGADELTRYVPCCLYQQPVRCSFGERPPWPLGEGH